MYDDAGYMIELAHFVSYNETMRLVCLGYIFCVFHVLIHKCVYVFSNNLIWGDPHKILSTVREPMYIFSEGWERVLQSLINVNQEGR